MTIRRRLTVSFFVILALVCLNLGIYLYGKQRQNASVELLRRAISRQVLVASIQESLTSLQREVALLGETITEAASGGVAPEQLAQFRQRVRMVGNQLAELAALSDASGQEAVTALAKDYQDLGAGWLTFYENFGVNHTKALVALATQAEPLSQRVIAQLLPQFREEEERRVEAASSNFQQVGRVTEQLTVGIFLISTLLALVIGYRLSRSFAHGLNELKTGAAYIGQGQLDHRILVHSRDELGDLAHAYNDMAENLRAARQQLVQANEQMEERNQELQRQQNFAEELLLNILPPQVAEELRTKSEVAPKYYEDVTILFTDFVGFSLSTEKLAAEDLVRLLHDYFTAFDLIAARYHVEKLKTIGDSYMCVAGMPVGRRARRTPSHPVDAVLAACEMVRAVQDREQAHSQSRWAVRIGIHTCAVIAGVVGIQKFAFDIWGDSVNLASRMESSGAPNRINLSQQTYARVKDFFDCEHRGKVLTKDKKELDMYFANGLLPSLADGTGQVPPEPFLRRYRIYFQKELPAFPASLLEPLRTVVSD